MCVCERWKEGVEGGAGKEEERALEGVRGRASVREECLHTYLPTHTQLSHSVSLSLSCSHARASSLAHTHLGKAAVASLSWGCHIGCVT